MYDAFGYKLSMKSIVVESTTTKYSRYNLVTLFFLS